ncbi:leucine-rich repeat extensin-like protein 1 [Hordeum vulgare]|nr:leucine-rich repeat extensin-like protein 1 [Hordeum vulgare]
MPRPPAAAAAAAAGLLVGEEGVVGAAGGGVAGQGEAGGLLVVLVAVGAGVVAAERGGVGGLGDNQLSYVNGDTKILSIERPLRFPDFAARLAGLAAARGDLCVKYQLPGEDLDALVSVTNDEDLEHLVIEYDRFHLFRAAPGSGGSSRGGSTPRLRVFLFPVQPPSRPPSPPKQQEQREWYLDLKSASPAPLPQALPPPQQQNQQMKQEAAPVESPPPAAPMAVPQSVVMASKTGPDYLFGFDYGGLEERGEDERRGLGRRVAQDAGEEEEGAHIRRRQ